MAVLSFSGDAVCQIALNLRIPNRFAMLPTDLWREFEPGESSPGSLLIGAEDVREDQRLAESCGTSSSFIQQTNADTA
jgi:hypothetical protein